MAYWAAQEEKKIAGVISCGAGGDIGGRKQVVYGLCGSNCFNRTDMANAFKKVSHKGAILRYFEGKHAWANKEMCDDAITHLNGVFLEANQSKYADEYKHYVYQVGELIKAKPRFRTKKECKNYFVSMRATAMVRTNSIGSSSSVP